MTLFTFTLFSLIVTAESFALKTPLTRKSSTKGPQQTESSCKRTHDHPLPSIAEPILQTAAAVAFSLAVLANPFPAYADGSTKDFKFPPIDKTDKNRCDLNSSKIGQANAARDKLYDLRQCDLSNKDASGFDLSGVIMSETILTKAKFIDAQFSKAFLQNSNFDGADFSNGIIDRANFRGSSLKGAIFSNAVLTGTSFEGADVENADFTDVYIGDFDNRSLCRNPTLVGENPITGADTRLSAGCVGARK